MVRADIPDLPVRHRHVSPLRWRSRPLRGAVTQFAAIGGVAIRQTLKPLNAARAARTLFVASGLDLAGGRNREPDSLDKERVMVRASARVAFGPCSMGKVVRRHAVAPCLVVARWNGIAP